MKGRVWGIAGFCCRLAAGGVFVYAAVVKLLAPAEEFAFAIETYKVLPAALTLAPAHVLPWVELVAGAFLAAGFCTRYAALAVGGMLVFFELLMAQAMLRGLEVTNCGCFGSGANIPIGVEFALNLLTLACCWCAWKHGDRLLAADGVIRRDH
ncbi:MAG: MauE/DoxX family redox-associated membrane protein [Elusimicrobiales bacterium]